MSRSARAAALVALTLVACSPPVAARAAVYSAADASALSTALADAQASPEADTVNVGPGTFAGSFTYNGSSKVEIVGAGAGQTILSTSSGYALLLQGSAAGDRVANLTATVTGGSTVRGIWVGAPSATVEDVTLTRTGGTNLFAVVLMGTDQTVRRVTVDGAFSRAFEVQAPGATLTDITARNLGSANGIEVDAPGATATVQRAQITGGNVGASATFSGALTITDSLIDMRGSLGSALSVGDNGNNAVHTSSIVADRMTVIGDAMSNSAASVGAGTAGEADVMSIAIRDSIVSGFTTPLRCFEAGAAASGTLTVSDTALTGAVTNSCDDGMMDPGVTQTNVTALAPGFIDAAGSDFRLRWDSPLLDLGGTTPLPGATDLAGLERVVDGDGAGIATVDLGAYEYQRRPPVIAATATPATATTGQSVAFAASATDQDPLEDPLLTYAWSFDGGSAVTGPAQSRAFTTAGTRVATLTVTDPAGASASQEVPVTVTAPASTPTPTPAPTPTPTPTVKVPFTAAKALVLPSAKACLSRRSFAIRVRIPKGLTAKDATVTITGRKRLVVKGRSLTAPIDLRGLPKGTFKVAITVRATDGRKVTATRTYRTCAPKRR